MSDSLPVVQKAQPPKQLVCWGCGEDTYTTFRDKRFCGKDCLADHYFSEGYSEAAARYEKREQQLKNKIKELAVEFESWRTTNDSNLGFSFGVFLKQHSEELLGLSKQ